MNKKIILVLTLWMGCISTNVLQAQENSIDKDSVKEADMINVAFRKIPKKFSAGAVTIINPEELLKYDNITSVEEAISGRVPGIIGGLNLHGLGNALVVIDGIPPPAHEGFNSVNPLSNVLIEEIAQITILKDVNAAALYGAKGRNGVILITTKRGKVNSRKVTAYVSQGFSSPVSLPKYLGSADYMELYNEARANDGLAPLYTQSAIDGTRSGTKPWVYPDADYYNSDFLKSFKPDNRAVVDFSGGNTNAQYYLNVGYEHSGTLLNMGQGKQDQDTRLNVRSNINFRINKFITSNFDISAVYNISRRANGNYWSDASSLLPNLYAPLIDTDLVINKKYINTAQLINGRYILGGRSGYLNNVWGNLNVGGYSNTFNSALQFNNGINMDLNAITKGLSLKTFFNISFYNQYAETQANTYAVYQPVLGGANNEEILSVTKIGVDKFSGTQGIGANPDLDRIFAAYAMLDYNRLFGKKHAVGASIMAYGDLHRQTSPGGIYYTAVPPEKDTHLGATINYAYADKYIIDFSSAVQSSIKLPDGNRVGFSPTVGLSWVLSQENFLKSSSVLNYLKLRVSAGKLNTDLDMPQYNSSYVFNYLYQSQYVAGPTFAWNEIRNLPSTRYNNVPNDKLFYEARNNINIGVEAVLFNKSLSIDGNLFQDHITGIVGQVVNAVPDFLGGFYPYQNYGANMYKGIELGATWRKAITTDFGFDIGANMTFLKTEVLKGDENYANGYQYRKGKPVGAIFGLESLGFFKDNQDIAGSPVQTFGTVKPGDIKYKDQNGDNVINGQDEVMIGNSTPGFVGSLNLTVRYKNLSLFALASVRNKVQTYYNNAYYWVYGALKYSEVVLGRWTPATAGTATYPELTTQSNSNNFRASTFWLADVSRISIDRLQLTYTIPKSLASKLALKTPNLYIRASNIATFSKNVEKMQLNIGSEPQYRYYAIGLMTNF